MDCVLVKGNQIPQKNAVNKFTQPTDLDRILLLFVSTASGALVVGGVRDIYMYVYMYISPEIGLSVQWISQWQSVVFCGSLW